MVDVVSQMPTDELMAQAGQLGPKVGRRSLGIVLHSSRELGELCQ